MKTQSDLTQILRFSAELLAYAVLTRCPDAFLIEGGVTQGCFAYDFHFPSPFSKEMLPHIEATFHELITQDLPIHHREMIPDNAATFLKHKKRFYRASFAAESPGPLVDICEIDGFVDLCPGPYPKSTGELEGVKILEMSTRPPVRHRGAEKEVIRIEGTLKKLTKQRRALRNWESRVKNQVIIQKERGKDYREIHRCIWLADGVRLKRELRDHWEKVIHEKRFEIVETQGADLLNNHRALFRLSEIDLNLSPWRVAEMGRIVSGEGMDPWSGLYESKDYTYDRAHTFCLKKDLSKELISSLQFLEENSKIFGFESDIELQIGKNGKGLANDLKEACQTCDLVWEEKEGNETQLTWKLCDFFGRKWDGPFLKVQEEKEGMIVTVSLYRQLERLIAFLSERDEMDLNNLAKKKKI